MKVDRVKVRDIAYPTNVWLIEGIPEKDGQAAPLIVIDPGGDPDKILEIIDERPVAGVLLTHGHYDHVEAADEIADDCSSFLYMSEAELAASPQMLEEIRERYGIEVEVPRVDYKINDGDVLDLAGLKVEVMVTPGHTAGSTGYVITDPATGQVHYFSGDTLFARNYGRTDLLGGSQEEMEKSLERIAHKFDPSTKVYPGHGPVTTIEREAAANSWWPEV
ncbi:MAG: MBL fold metallo-hydrolase [Coriobacteriia bacterium]|nr:MBL fold metallo-hydrolase [Coriobacteriia bacterium]MCL2745923.1 MBL fold metallo-hydrolase [Coriobacteriia bacterium]MCL2870863.1 MBL fold metallo-hydrolase [Coriobacteriia bacterium]